MLEVLKPEDLYRLYQLLDDLAHMEAGVHLAGLILDEPDIRRELPGNPILLFCIFRYPRKTFGRRFAQIQGPLGHLEIFSLLSSI